MKKITFKIALLAITSISCLSLTAQQGSSHLYTTDIPVYVCDNDEFGVDAKLNDLRIYSDAVTTNEGNPNSAYTANSIISAYSPSRTYDDYNFCTINSNDKGTWILVRNPNMVVELSKKIQVPNNDFLKIISLQYDFGPNRELLIFTGSLFNIENEESRMVVGSYNLLTNSVNLKAITRSITCTTTEGEFREASIASRGIGVRKLLRNNGDKFMAIGHVGDFDNGQISPFITPQLCHPTYLPYAAYPMGTIFQVTNTGLINIHHIEIKDFLFKPHNVTDAIQYLGGAPGIDNTSIIVSGVRILDQLFQVDNSPPVPNQNNETLVGPGVYTFDAIHLGGSTWSINVEDGINLRMKEYAYMIPTLNYLDFYVFVEDELDGTSVASRTVFMGGTDRDEAPLAGSLDQGTGDLMFFKFDVNTANGFYTKNQEVRYDLNSSAPDAVDGTFYRFLPNKGESNFEVIFTLDDHSDSWGQENQTSIGLMSISKSNIVSTTLPFKSIYNDDVTGPDKVTNIYNVTGLKVYDNIYSTSPTTYLLADGDRSVTQYARAHFNFSYSGDFNCQDAGTAHQEGLTCINSPHNESCPYPELNMPTKTQVMYEGNIQAFVVDVSYQPWDCEFVGLPFERKKFTNESDIALEPILVKRNEDIYAIEQVEENIVNYQFYSISGQLISIRMVNNSFSLQGLAPGMYILRYDAQNESHTEKLIVD